MHIDQGQLASRVQEARSEEDRIAAAGVLGLRGVLWGAPGRRSVAAMDDESG